jgi:hypothetical protein
VAELHCAIAQVREGKVTMALQLLEWWNIHSQRECFRSWRSTTRARCESRVASLAVREVVMDRAASSFEWTTRRQPGPPFDNRHNSCASNKHNNSRNTSRSKSDMLFECARRI